MTASPAEDRDVPPITEPDPVPGPDRERSEELAAGLLGLIMVVGAVVVLVDAAGMRDSDAALGPAAAPTLIGVLLGVLGGALALRGARRLRTGPGPDLGLRRLWRLAALVGALIAFALLLPIMGYVVSSAALFTATALLLGAPHPARVVAYGWTVAATAFLIFDRLIGLTLPTGPWGF